MFKFATVLLFAATVPALAQTRLDWRPVGNAAVELGLADLATGPVERAWYGPGGSSLRIRTGLGKNFETNDFETWLPLPADLAIPTIVPETTRTLPEPGAQVRLAAGDPLRLYAFGRYVHRSEDGGRHWENTTRDRQGSIVGDGLRDLAVSPSNPDEITVAGGAGVFRSVDGGRSWHGLNGNLPNLPGPRILNVPPGLRGAILELGGGLAIEWLAGERRAWTVTDGGNEFELALRRSLSEAWGTDVTAVAYNNQVVYAGDANGRLSVSTDGTVTWLHSPDPRRGRVNSIWIDPRDSRIALAAFSVRPGRALEPQTLLHTINAGGGWDTVSVNLPETSVNGVTADPFSNAVYVATDAGVFSGSMSLATLGAMPRWTALAGLPAGRVSDVRLDSGRTQLWAAVEGAGLLAALAPHRLTDPLVVSAADLLARAAAPGALLSVVGARVNAANAGGAPVSILDAKDAESQIQLPFNLAGTNVSLSVTGPQGTRQLPPIPLQATAPSIFVEVSGAPLLRDGDRGVMLDGRNPGRSHMRVQIMASGLGQVRPDWPAGTPAPLDNTPQVVAPVTVYLDREPVEVLRAVLWPEYTGVYLVEIELPTILQSGMAELYIQVGGQESNRVRLYVEPGV